MSRIIQYIRGICAFGMILGLNLGAVDRLPHLALSSYEQQISTSVMTQQESDLFSLARKDIVAADDSATLINTLLAVRHNAERMQSAAGYAEFVQFATHTVLQNVMHETFSILDATTKSLAYWKYQLGHQTHYFLHKNPAKWFGKPQHEEIREHIDQLTQMQKIYFAHIGTATQQLRAVSNQSQAKIAVTDAIHQMEYIVGLPESTIVPANMLDQQIEALALICNQLALYVKRAERAMRGNIIPSLVNRYGLSAMMATLALIGYFKLRSDAHTSLDDALPWIRAGANDVRNSVARAAANVLGVTGQVDRLSGSFVKGMKKRFTKIIERFEVFRDLFHASGNVGVIGTLLGGASGLVTGVVAGPSLGMAAGYASDTIREQIIETEKSIETRMKDLKQNVQTLNQGIADFQAQSFDVVNTVEKYGNKVIRLSKLAVTIGIPVAAWCTYKLTRAAYNTLHGLVYPEPDYAGVREALIEIAHILNNQQNVTALETDQLGALMYYMHVVCEQQVAVDYKDQFAQDVTELASESYDVTQKLRIIDRMYRTYPFLTPVAPA